ncbi:hypothetical protein [Actinokineospora sp.]|uniref:hypothetical protein n=1 Tax=Actinokineospora sp. TaxID=1872133 RepID=UPI0040381724
MRGLEFAADSHPENGVVILRSDTQGSGFVWDNGTWRAEVSIVDCERLDEVTTRADYLGHECHVVGIAEDGSTGLYYLGPEKSKAAADGFVQIDPGTWAKNVSVRELSRLREHHADLLFADWVRSR